MNYVPLNIKTGNYLLSSMIKIPDLVKKAKENGLKALTITDNNMYGVIDFYKECVKNDIKPIVGLEVEIEEKIILYCQNYEGYKNLIKLSTIMSEKELTLEDLNIYSSNIICIMPYESRKIYNDLNKIYKYIFIGYKDQTEKEKIKSSNTVYMNEILCLEKQDEQFLKYLYAIKEGKLAVEIILDKTNVSLFPLHNINEENNQKIYELCNLEINFHQNLMPLYNTENSYEYLKQKCIEGLKKIFGSEVAKPYAVRLKYELDVISKMGFCDYFLIVADYVNYAKDNNVLVGPGRGSSASSLVAYLLNITTVDPIKYNLLFERFLNPERISMPDIDVDFEDAKRDLVVKYCINKYGEKKVAPIITFGTLGPRQAIKDVGRVVDGEPKKLDILSKLMNPFVSLNENYKNAEVKRFLDFNKELKTIYQMAIKFEGLKRHTSIHAAGIVMSKYNLDEVIPLDKSHNSFYTTGYDMDYLEEIGLLKMDFLGLKNLTLIHNILDEIPELTFDNIKDDDEQALSIFTIANTVGIFQFESDGMMNFLKKFKPNTFEDIIAALALYRPGPMKNIDTYIRRKQGKIKVEYLHPDLEEVLKPTYGIIVYQEQIMQIANIMAGYSLAEADILRKAMSKKKESILLKEKDKFIKQSIERGYEENTATEVYNLILKFADYGFPRSHSAAYATISYRMAYLKAHYPKLFMKHLLSSAINSEYKTKEYMYECKLNNIEVISPDINQSMDNYITTESGIIFPLTNIKNVGMGAVRAILEERGKSPFKDIFDFVRRCYGKAVTTKTILNLILAGAFDKLGYNKNTLITNLEIILNYGEIGELLDSDDFKPEIERLPELSKTEIMNSELEVFGFYLSDHPVTEYKLRYPKTVELRYLDDYFDRLVEIVVYVDKIKIVETKKREKMMFITGSDELTKLDIVVFPKIYKRFAEPQIGDILLVTGKVEKRFDQLQLSVTVIKKLNN